jgi:hypothetical protein
MTEDKKCVICSKVFKPSTHRPEQSVCSSPECQHKRQLNNMKEWRAKKAASGDSASWKESCRRQTSEWRKKHQTYLKLYREEHKEERTEYMKEYMRQYRKSAKVSNGKI